MLWRQRKKLVFWCKFLRHLKGAIQIDDNMKLFHDMPSILKTNVIDYYFHLMLHWNLLLSIILMFGLKSVLYFCLLHHIQCWYLSNICPKAYRRVMWRRKWLWVFWGSWEKCQKGFSHVNVLFSRIREFVGTQGSGWHSAVWCISPVCITPGCVFWLIATLVVPSHISGRRPF